MCLININTRLKEEGLTKQYRLLSWSQIPAVKVDTYEAWSRKAASSGELCLRGTRLNRLLKRWAPSVPWRRTTWQFAWACSGSSAGNRMSAIDLPRLNSAPQPQRSVSILIVMPPTNPVQPTAYQRAKLRHVQLNSRCRFNSLQDADSAQTTT